MTIRIIAFTLLALGLYGCGQQGQEEPAQPESAAAEPAANAEPDPVALPRTASPEGARVFFISPADGEAVSNPIKVEFGIEGMEVARAGENRPNSGHHHILIDTGLPHLGTPIPADQQHIHFGDGSTSAEITLPAGQHTLRMLLGDHQHIPHDPPVVSEPITITVE